MVGRYLFLQTRLFILLIPALLVFTGCNKDDKPKDVKSTENPLAPVPDVTTSVAGIVLDENGVALPDVQVQVHGKQTRTDADGSFLFRNIAVPGNRCVITCRKDGYFTTLRAEKPVKDNLTSTRIRLMSSAQTHTISAVSGGKATLENGSSVDIPANGLVTAAGNPYNGQVSMSVRYMDPTALGFGEFVPGGDLLARRTDERTAMLYSYGILRVQLTGSNGEALQVAPGKTSTITVDIPETQLATAPASIPLWFFDEEAGAWQEEGQATRQGDKYIGTVSHFTDWNCDDPMETATVIGKLVDCAGRPVDGQVNFGQTSSQIESFAGIDQKDASFSKTVPAGVATIVVVHRPFLLTPLTRQSMDSEGEGMLLVPVPPLRPGQVYDVGILQPFPCPNAAKGKFKTNAGDTVEKLSFKVLDSGPNERIAGSVKNLYNPPADFCISAFPPNAAFTMTATTASGISATRIFQTKAPEEITELGEIDLTGATLLITVSGVVICQNTPLSGAQIKAEWPGGSASATTNSLGVFGLSVPSNQPVALLISHVQGTATRTFQTPASGAYQVGSVDICAPTASIGENSFTINGDIYSNARMVLTPRPYPNTFASYDRDKNLTTVSVINQPDTLFFSLHFLGKTTGLAGKSDITGARIYRKQGTRTINYHAGMGFGAEGTGADITVTRYDAVKGLVEGTFSGTFSGDNGSTVTVTNGKFSVIRNNDFSLNECRGTCL